MPNDTWTIKRCLDWTRDYLRDKGDERPRLSAEWLLAGVCGLTRTDIYVGFDKPMSEEELAAMHAAVVRRAKGEPLQYIVGETGFRHITVACEPGVLIPRPETELLVEEVLGYIDREVLGGPAPHAHEKVELPWNAEVEAARKAELEAAAQRDESEANAALQERELRDSDFEDDSDEVADAVTGDEAGGDEVAADDVESSSGDAAPAARVLEVGCGTGCISLSIAYERQGKARCVAIDIEPRAVDLTIRNRDALGIDPADVDVRLGNLVSPLDRDQGKARCVAIDIEPRAVDLTIRNRDALGIDPADVDVRLGNLVSPLDRETEWGTFDVLVSNPPYIPSSVMGTLPHEVADYEPSLALDGGADGLDIFRRLVNAAPHMLKPGGLLACELYEGHLDAAAELCRSAGMRDVRVVDDLTGRPRIVLARV